MKLRFIFVILLTIWMTLLVVGSKLSLSSKAQAQNNIEKITGIKDIRIQSNVSHIAYYKSIVYLVWRDDFKIYEPQVIYIPTEAREYVFVNYGNFAEISIDVYTAEEYKKYIINLPQNYKII